MGLLMSLCFVIFLLHSQVINCSSSFSSNSSSTQLCHHDQSFALLHFMENFNFNNSFASSSCEESYPKMASWKEGSDCCTWDGVTCHKVTGHVIGLDLSCSRLDGTLHSNSTLFLLPHLQWLNLADNDFNESPISSRFGHFASLRHLNLSHSQFSGHIPSELSHLAKLVSLDLGRNMCELETLSLTRLVLNLTQLQHLFLPGVDMFSVKLPSSFMNLSSSLTSLVLDSGGSQGNFPNPPKSIFHRQTGLRGNFPHPPKSIFYRLTGLHGNFPNYIFNLPNLQTIRLSGNDLLTGYFPINFNRSSPLKILDLSNSKFSGEIPNSVGNLKSLNYLDLHSCNFSGSIPASLGNLTHITELYLHSNHFTGDIPSSLSNLVQLNYLGLSSNNFTRFSFSPLNMTRLVGLDLSYNELAGPIPASQLITSSQVRLPNLEILYLSYNSLNGTIPSWVFALPSLYELDLSKNHLSGHIPEFQYYDSLVYVVLDNNMLQGPIPSSIFRLVNLTDLRLSSNKLSGLVEAHEFINLQNLETLHLSGSGLSWSTKSSNLSFTLPQFRNLGLSYCNLSEFPNFLRAQERLERLDLSNNKIYGGIPNWVWDMGKDSLYYLNLSSNFLTSVLKLPWNNLRIIDLHSNLLQGPLPVPPLSTEVFSISNNKLTGKIPSSICNVSFLTVVNLSNNSLSGVIPKFLGNFNDLLSVLDLRMNNFHGTIPSSICNASFLEVLNLFDNNLSGIIPECLGNFSIFLSVLNLPMNSFHGTIPGTFAEGNRLRNLAFNGNQLEGPVPQSLINCRELEVLNLGNNKINDTFPYWLDTLPNLQVLVLRSNKFHGFIRYSKTRFPFPKLRIMDLSHNEFTGLLPTKYFKNLKAMMDVDEEKIEPRYKGEYYSQDSVMVTTIGLDIELRRIPYPEYSVNVTMKGLEFELVKIPLTLFTIIDLSSNKFQGEISNLIGNLHSLRELNLSHNIFTRQIPPSLGNLTLLESLDLSSNKLDGAIPLQLTSLTFLAVLNLSYNYLEGPIPQGKQFCTFDNNSYVGNLRLCGFPLSKKCSDDEVPQPPPSIQKEDNSEFGGGFGWKAVLMGYGSGMVIGLAWGYHIFLTRTPEWLLRIVEGVQHRKVKRSNRSAARGRRRRRN